MISRRNQPLKVYAPPRIGYRRFSASRVVRTCRYVEQSLHGGGIGHGCRGILLRSARLRICLLPPTLMMGATLPAISRWIEDDPASRIMVGIFLRRKHRGWRLRLPARRILPAADLRHGDRDLRRRRDQFRRRTGQFLFAARHPLRNAGPASWKQPSARQVSWPVFFAIALSGLCALGAEVDLDAHLSLMLGPTVYTFSIILGVFFTGLGIGSGGGSALAREHPIPRMWFALCQLLQVLASHWPHSCSPISFLTGEAMSIRPTPLARFPQRHGTVRHRYSALDNPLGRQFPPRPCERSAAGNLKNTDPGRLVGEVYGANTIGAIVGSVAFSLIFIPLRGHTAFRTNPDRAVCPRRDPAAEAFVENQRAL